MAQLIKKGNRVLFEKDCCKICNRENVLVARAKLTGYVYKMIFVKENFQALASLVVTDEVWQRRFGQLNYDYSQKIKNSEFVEGMTSNGKFGRREPCEVCCEGKQSRLPFKSKGRRANSLLQVIHGDICGPMENTFKENERILSYIQQGR